MPRVKHVAIEEVAGNLAELLDSVRADQVSIVVEYAGGEQVIIKPHAPTRRGRRKEQSQDSAPMADNNAKPQPSGEAGGTSNISSVGAAYEMDPDSVTPG